MAETQKVRRQDLCGLAMCLRPRERSYSFINCDGDTPPRDTTNVFIGSDPIRSTPIPYMRQTQYLVAII